jgi:hypothetical protein
VRPLDAGGRPDVRKGVCQAVSVTLALSSLQVIATSALWSRAQPDKGMALT